MNRFLKIPLIIFLILFSSCLDLKISSIKSEETVPAMKKIFVSLKGFKTTEVFYENMRFGLYEGFNKHGIASSYYIKRALSLETDADVKKRLTDFAPDEVLQIDLSELQHSIGEIENMVYSFDIRLMNPDYTKILWRATLDLKSAVTSEAAAKKGAEAIIRKMEEDGLFGKK